MLGTRDRLENLPVSRELSLQAAFASLMTDRMLLRDFAPPPQPGEFLQTTEANPEHHRYEDMNAMERFSVFMQQHRSQRPRLFSTGSIGTNRESKVSAPRALGSANRLSSSRSFSAVLATEQRSKARQEKAAKVRGESSNDAEPSWNSSTLLPPAPTKPLRHQILDKTFQPPAPAYVGQTEANDLLNRLGKTTVSSRLKDTHRSDPYRLGGAPNDLEDEDTLHDTAPDTRARDAIQTLLFYRREVEKRLQRDACEQKK